MIPAGYLYKRVVPAPAWLGDGRVVDIHSVSGCISEDFCDYVASWRHNGFWLFDRPSLMEPIAGEEGVSLSGLTLFYYAVHEREYDEGSANWKALPALQGTLDVRPPAPATMLTGYDVVTFSQGNRAECSPLSCNRRSLHTEVNAHCLFGTLAEAEAALESGLFDKSEPGPFRIVAVHTCPTEIADADDRSV